MNEIPNRVIEQALNHLEKTTDTLLSDEELDHVAELDAIEDVEPCEVSEELCEVWSKFHDDMQKKHIRRILEYKSEKLTVDLSAAEYQLITEKAREIGMDPASYMKFITLNTKVDLTMKIDEIKSLYKLYYEE